MTLIYRVETASGGRLNLRDRASADNGKIIDKLSNGAKVEVIDATGVDGWWWVRVPGMLGAKMGWISSGWLKPDEPYFEKLGDGNVGDAMRAVAKSVLGKPKPEVAANIELMIGVLDARRAEFGLTTPLTLAHFLAQAGWESTGFSALLESCYYKTTKQMAGSYGDRAYDRPDVLRDTIKCANWAYAGRNGNGDEASGDGARYRGRGVIQLTGKNNYRDASERLGLPLLEHPEKVADAETAMLTALDFWRANNILAVCGPSEMHISWAGSMVNRGWAPGNSERKSALEDKKRIALFDLALRETVKLASSVSAPIVVETPPPVAGPPLPLPPQPEPAPPPIAEAPAEPPAPQPAPAPPVAEAPPEPPVTVAPPSAPPQPTESVSLDAPAPETPPEPPSNENRAPA